MSAVKDEEAVDGCPYSPSDSRYMAWLEGFEACLDWAQANLIPPAPTPPLSTKGTGAGQETASGE